MSDFAQFLGVVLSIIVLICFFVVVARTGAVCRALANLEREAAEQTRYLAAISANIARQVGQSSSRNERAEGSG